MELQHINIDKLKISPLNVRKHGEKNGDDLIASIRTLGVLQPLLVRPNCEGYEVIAGQRRLHACRAIAEGGDINPLPCIVMEDGDDAVAIEASLAENIARLPMDELDQYEAFRDLNRKGQSIEDIAAHFGVTERLVKQRLAIANLYTPILNAYRREELDACTMRILTIATTRQQKAWYKRFKSKEDYTPTGQALKHWLFGGDEIPLDNALFDPADYKGAIISDLFEDERYFADSAAFWELQSLAIARMTQDYREDGWADVILHDVGEHWPYWGFRKTPKNEGGHIHIVCGPDGQVTVYEGYLSEKECAARQRAEKGDTNATATRPEITKTMQNYLALHRHAAVRTTLLDHHGIALRLAVAQIIAGSEHWNVYADPQKANTDAVAQSLDTNDAQAVFAEERQHIRGLLGINEDENEEADTIVSRKHDWYRAPDTVVIFAKLLKLDDDTVARVLTFVVAETLTCGGLSEVLGTLLKVDMADHWQPDQTFFDLLHDKEAINAMVRELAGQNAADAHLTATAKVQKSILQNCLSGERKAETENWQPRYMTFPMQAYTEREGIPALTAWEEVEELFEDE